MAKKRTDYPKGQYPRTGIRDDNRPENLELWNKVQPSGVRSTEAAHCPTCTCRKES